MLVMVHSEVFKVLMTFFSDFLTDELCFAMYKIKTKKTMNIDPHDIFQYVWDPEYLLSPTTGPAKQERAAMEEVFPINYDYFQVGRHY